jgi:Fe-S cluster assembly protein SufD
MSHATMNIEQHYLSCIDRFREEHRGRTDPEWLRKLRGEAVASFRARGFPQPREEAWRHTPIRSVMEQSFEVGGREDAGRFDPVSFGPLLSPKADAHRLVFVNGRYAPEHSRSGALPRGAVMIPWEGDLVPAWEGLQKHWARYADSGKDPFVALNTALCAAGAVVSIPDETVIERPIHLVHVVLDGPARPIFSPRVLIVAGRGSQATILESYWGGAGRGYLVNGVTELAAHEGAVVDHYKLQQEGAQGYHVATVQLYLKGSSTVRTHFLSMGGALVRNNVRATLDGEGAEATLNGLFLLSNGQHLDNFTEIIHAKPHGSSREIYKGILDGQSRGVFSGKIHVVQGAQKTDAKQTNRNLLLSDRALMDTQPQLEIYADDVKCTHGATIGQIDEEALFYIRSRGVGRREARAMLVEAFAHELLDQVRIAALREHVQAELGGRLGAGTARPPEALHRLARRK